MAKRFRWLLVVQVGMMVGLYSQSLTRQNALTHAEILTASGAYRPAYEGTLVLLEIAYLDEAECRIRREGNQLVWRATTTNRPLMQ